MTHPSERDEKILDPAQTDVVRRLRRLMLLSSLIMIGGFIAVFGVIAYRLSTTPQEEAAIEANISLPNGARVLSTAVSDGRLVVTIEVAGATEVRLYDLGTLKPRGRLRLEGKP
jgi:hypothetical protein